MKGCSPPFIVAQGGDLRYRPLIQSFIHSSDEWMKILAALETVASVDRNPLEHLSNPSIPVPGWGPQLEPLP